MVPFHPLFYFVLAITSSIFSGSKSLDLEGGSVSLSVDLIHRDSPKSPFHNHSLTHSQRMAGAIRRSLRHRQMSASSDIIQDLSNGEFLMKVSIGTPPVEMLAILDTGRDLMWIQCQPCKGCIKQYSPLFNPQKSSTFKKLSCKECHSISDVIVCDSYNRSCTYYVDYGDKSYSYGDLATETIALGSLKFSKMIIGCGHKDGGSFGPKSTGIVGIGGGPNSLVSQLGPRYGAKFSYCLVNIGSKKSSKLSFGENKGFSHFAVVSTPLVRKHPSTFYFVTLEKITVGHTKIQVLNLSSGNTSMEGNMIVDSGTTLTMLPSNIYSQVESEVRKYINAVPVKDPLGILRLCYINEKTLRFPRITMHFKGAKLKLRSWNTFISTSHTTMCLAFAPSANVTILGNVAQINVFVGYDLTKKLLSFRPTNCEKLRY